MGEGLLVIVVWVKTANMPSCKKNNGLDEARMEKKKILLLLSSTKQVMWAGINDECRQTAADQFDCSEWSPTWAAGVFFPRDRRVRSPRLFKSSWTSLPFLVVISSSFLLCEMTWCTGSGKSHSSFLKLPFDFRGKKLNRLFFSISNFPEQQRAR